MCKINLGVMLLIFFFITTYISKAIGSHTSQNSLVITKDIEFQVEVLSSLAVGVDPVELDFGDIQKNTKDIIVKEAELKFKAAFDQNVQITVDYDTQGDLMPGDPDYAMYQITPTDTSNTTANDKIDVYIKRVKALELQKGNISVPIIGEIREVGDIKLGEYTKTIEATVYATPVSPVTGKTFFTEGGIK